MAKIIGLDGKRIPNKLNIVGKILGGTVIVLIQKEKGQDFHRIPLNDAEFSMVIEFIKSIKNTDAIPIEEKALINFKKQENDKPKTD